MQTKLLVYRLTWLIWLPTLLLIGGCGAAPARNTVQTPPRATMATHGSAPASAERDEPRRLLISAIHIDALIETVGINEQGDLDTPGQDPWNHTGWYSAGQLPGKQGSAVIDGHLDRPGGSPAVFWSLRELRPGDDVTVIMTSGKTLHFRVQNLAFYAPDQAPLQEIFANTTGTYLNLITCAGTWIPAQHQTTQRLVVYTSLQ